MLPESLEVFLETAESLNFSEVAKRRYTTQPTISRQISALEEEWGLSLFLRSNKGLRLTPEGAVMARTCRKLRQQIDAGLKQARNIQSTVGEKLRLGFLHSMDTERIIMPWLREFAADHPELELSVTHGSFGTLREDLNKGKLDLIYTLSFDRGNFGDNVVFNTLGKVQPVFALSECHPLYARENLSLSDCGNELFFLPSESDAPGREADLQMILRAHGISEARIRFVSDLESALFQMRLGKGLAILDSSTCYYGEAGYRFIIPSELKAQIELICAWRKDNLNPILTLMVNTQKIEI